MIESSEARKTRSNAKDQPNDLRQRRSFCSFSAFCSFYESPDDGFWAWDESLWLVPALFHVVVAVARGGPTAAKGGAWPLAPAPTSRPRRGAPTAASTPPPPGPARPAECERRRRRA